MGKSVTPGERTHRLRFSPDLGSAKTEPFYVKKRSEDVIPTFWSSRVSISKRWGGDAKWHGFAGVSTQRNSSGPEVWEGIIKHGSVLVRETFLPYRILFGS